MKTLLTKTIVTTLLSLLVAVPVFAKTATRNVYPNDTKTKNSVVKIKDKKVISKKVVKAKAKMNLPATELRGIRGGEIKRHRVRAKIHRIKKEVKSK